MRSRRLKLTVSVFVVLLMTASAATAQTLKYLPTPQELPAGFSYTSIEVASPMELDSIQESLGVMVIYAEKGDFTFNSFDDNEIVVFELSNNDDAKRAYTRYLSGFEQEFSEKRPEPTITEQNTFGDESISWSIEIPGESYWLLLFRNGRFVVIFLAESDYEFDESAKIAITRTLPSIIDANLERSLPVNTPKPTIYYTPTPAPSPSPVPGFEIIFALSGLLAVVLYRIRTRQH